jgi:aspartyl-tRNA(Asn)/glutamyl-tRNA(Gln) amidotransferase subunit B
MSDIYKEMSSIIINFLLPLSDFRQKINPYCVNILAQLRSGDLISAQQAKEVILQIYEGDRRSPLTILYESGMLEVANENELDMILKKVVEDNPKAVTDYKEGRKAALGHLMGEAIRKVPKGAQPKEIKSKLETLLN